MGDREVLKISMTAALFALLLGGCVTGGPHSPEVAAADDRECQSYGAKPGTDVYIQCRITKNSQHEQAMATVLSGAGGGGSTTCQGAGGNTAICY